MYSLDKFGHFFNGYVFYSFYKLSINILLKSFLLNSTCTTFIYICLKEKKLALSKTYAIVFILTLLWNLCDYFCFLSKQITRIQTTNKEIILWKKNIYGPKSWKFEKKAKSLKSYLKYRKLRSIFFLLKNVILYLKRLKIRHVALLEYMITVCTLHYILSRESQLRNFDIYCECRK